MMFVLGSLVYIGVGDNFDVLTSPQTALQPVTDDFVTMDCVEAAPEGCIP